MKHLATLLAAISLFASIVDRSTAAEPDDVSWLSDVQQPPQVFPDDAPQLPALITGDTSLQQWEKQRTEIRQVWLDYLGPLAVAKREAPQLKVVQQEAVDGIVRQLVEYESEPGQQTQAYLLKPARLDGPTAGVVVFHSTVNHSIHQPAGVMGVPEKAIGLKLAKRGYVVFCPRNFLWPTNDKIEAKSQTAASQKRHPKSKGMAKMLYDAQLAVDILIAQPEVDDQRIGSVGHSLGAKEVLYLAAFDQRVKVTVSSEGGIGTRFSNWDAPWYLGPDIRGPDFSREHHEILALIAPRPFLLLGGDSADGDRSWPFVDRAMAVYRLYGGQPRLGLYNHQQGHAIPKTAEERIYVWFETYLPAK